MWLATLAPLILLRVQLQHTKVKDDIDFYLSTYLHGAVFEKLILAQLVKTFPTFYRT